jgi:hypothetical protein
MLRLWQKLIVWRSETTKFQEYYLNLIPPEPIYSIGRAKEAPGNVL